jgi:phage shock protein E
MKGEEKVKMNSLVIGGAILAGFLGLRYLQRKDWVSPVEAQAMVGRGAHFVDVRSPQEYGSSHLPGASNIPLQELPQRLKELEPKDQDVVLYCLSGARSSAAKRMLTQAGFSSVHNLGAMNRWG